MLRKISLAAAALALLAGTAVTHTAEARISFNKIKPNGIASNKIKPNRIAANKIKPNRIAANKIKPNRIAANKIKPNKIKPNGMAANGANLDPAAAGPATVSAQNLPGEGSVTSVIFVELPVK